MFKRNHQHKVVEPGQWPEPVGKARVLIENPDRAQLFAYTEILREAGYDVATCRGPVGADGERVSCPLVEHKPCPLVDGADAVFSTCDLAESHGILGALTAGDGPPVVFEVPKPRFDEYSDVAGDATMLPTPVTEDRLLTALEDALD